MRAISVESRQGHHDDATRIRSDDGLRSSHHALDLGSSGLPFDAFRLPHGHSIFVAVIGLIVSRESATMSLTVLILLLCIFGILLCLQMAIVLGRLSGQNGLWEWQLRGIELAQEWQGQKLVTGLYRLHETRQPVEDLRNAPPIFKPNWAFRQHRQWWAHRSVRFPLFFGCVYGLFLIWAVAQLFR
jgi:hypothetical protein